MAISIALKNRMRVLFKEHDINARGMTDDEMTAKYEALTSDNEEQAPKTLAAKPARTAQKTPTTTTELATTIQDTTKTTALPASNPDVMAALAKLIEELTPEAPKAQPFDEAQLIRLIQEYGVKTLEIKTPTKREAITISGAHVALEDLIIFLNSNTMPYLVGPAGSGKTTLAIQAAEALDLDFFSSGAVTAPYELVGHHDANGVYKSTALRECYEHGGLFLFDEIDACSARALVAINQLLANGQFTFPDGVVFKHENFKAVGAANTKGKGATREYVGRNPLDGASLDRFVELEIEYDTALELRLAEAEYTAHGGETLNEARSWVARVQIARNVVENLSIKALITPRASIFGCALLANGMSREKIDAAVLFKGLSDDATAQLKGAL